MNTCEKNDHYYYFLFKRQYRTSYNKGTATPPLCKLLSQKKKLIIIIIIQSFFSILDFLEFFYIFLRFFQNALLCHYAGPLRSALAAGHYARHYRYFHPWLDYPSHLVIYQSVYILFCCKHLIFCY